MRPRGTMSQGKRARLSKRMKKYWRNWRNKRKELRIQGEHTAGQTKGQTEGQNGVQTCAVAVSFRQIRFCKFCGGELA